MLRISVAQILGEDGEETGRYRVVLYADGANQYVPLCSCADGHETPEAAVHCEDTQDMIRRLVHAMRNRARASRN